MIYQDYDDESPYVSELVGRPQRETSISSEDIMDLKILLETESSLESFISKV